MKFRIRAIATSQFLTHRFKYEQVLVMHNYWPEDKLKLQPRRFYLFLFVVLLKKFVKWRPLHAQTQTTKRIKFIPVRDGFSSASRSICFVPLTRKRQTNCKTHIHNAYILCVSSLHSSNLFRRKEKKSKRIFLIKATGAQALVCHVHFSILNSLSFASVPDSLPAVVAVAHPHTHAPILEPVGWLKLYISQHTII